MRVGFGLTVMGQNAVRNGRHEEARQYLDEALELNNDLNNVRGTAWVQVVLASLHAGLDELEKAIKAFLEGLANFESIGYQKLTRTIWMDLGYVYLAQSDFGRSWEAFEEMLVVARRTGDPLWIANAHLGFGQCAFDQQDWSTAKQHVEKAIGLFPPERTDWIAETQVQLELINTLAAGESPRHASGIKTAGRV